jgi:hypothetical protein
MTQELDFETPEELLEAAGTLDTTLLIRVTLPMKQAISVIARRNHMSMGNLARQALSEHLAAMYPEYNRIYNYYLRQQTESARNSSDSSRSAAQADGE